MTTNGKGVTKERLFAFVKETTALGKECGIVERAKAGKTGDSTASTYQRLAKSRLAGPVQQRRREADGLACLRGLGTRRGPPCCTRQRRLSKRLGRRVMLPSVSRIGTPQQDTP